MLALALARRAMRRRRRRQHACRRRRREVQRRRRAPERRPREVRGYKRRLGQGRRERRAAVRGRRGIRAGLRTRPREQQHAAARPWGRHQARRERARLGARGRARVGGCGRRGPARGFPLQFDRSGDPGPLRAGDGRCRMERGRDVEDEEAEEVLMVVLRDEARMRSRDLFPASVSEDDEAAACGDGCGWRPWGGVMRCWVGSALS
ncbi:hypothetical protein BJ912DRAFT_972589 [Pholiota molesta]|nr:hypothetical protein BJ912DRAFT_972589 [Pholiota molesta]